MRFYKIHKSCALDFSPIAIRIKVHGTLVHMRSCRRASRQFLLFLSFQIVAHFNSKTCEFFAAKLCDSINFENLFGIAKSIRTADEEKKIKI